MPSKLAKIFYVANLLYVVRILYKNIPICLEQPHSKNLAS